MMREPKPSEPFLEVGASGRRAAVRWWYLLAVSALILGCSLLIPLSAIARGVVRVGSIQVAPGQEHTHPLLVLGGPVRIEGTARAPVIVLGGNAYLDGSARDDLIAVAGDVFLGSHAVAHGNVVSLAGRVTHAPGSIVSGGVIGSEPALSPVAGGTHVGPLQFLVRRLRLAGLAVTALLLLGLGVWAILPWPALVTTATARRFRLRSALLGVGTLLWAPLIVIPLAVSLAGLPLAILLALGLGALWLIGVVSSAVRIGHRLLNLGGRPHSMLSATLAGLICLGLLPALPIVGSLALLLAGCVGLGAALVAVWDRDVAGDFAAAQALSGITLPD